MRGPWLLALNAFVLVSVSWAVDDEYHSVDKAIAAKIQPSWAANSSGPAAHLGIHLQPDPWATRRRRRPGGFARGQIGS